MTRVGRVPKVHAVAPVPQRMATLVDDGPGLLEDVALEHPEVIVLREYIALVDDAEVRS